MLIHNVVAFRWLRLVIVFLTLTLPLAMFSSGFATPAPSISFPLGRGVADVVPHQLVRTADDRVYAIAPTSQYAASLSIYWTSQAGLPNSSADFDQTASVITSSNPISVSPAYDGSRIIHVLVNTQSGILEDYPFDTSTHAFLPIKSIATGLAAVAGDYLGSSGLSAMFDLSGVLNVAYWSSDDHITFRAFTYDLDANTLTQVVGPTQVDEDGAANHPTVAISPLDDSLTVAWISEAVTPAQVLARTRTSTGTWESTEKVSTSSVWTSTNGGMNIDQGPSLVITKDGTNLLTYIENWDATGSYGRIHEATSQGHGWTDQSLNAYTHDPAIAADSVGNIYIIGHGHPNNPSCRSMTEICTIQKLNSGGWTNPEEFAVPNGSSSFDASPSVKWSAVGNNRPDLVEFLFFEAIEGSYNDTVLHYGRIGNGSTPTTPTATPYQIALAMIAK